MKFYSLSFTLLCLTITQLHASSDEHKEPTSPVSHDYSLRAESYQTDATPKPTNKRKVYRPPVSISFTFMSADQLLERFRSSQSQKTPDNGQLAERTALILAQSARLEEYMLAKYPNLIKPQNAQIHPGPTQLDH